MNNNKAANTRLAVAITVLIITATLILDRLLPEGIFLDGVTYAAISRNLAVGKGNFWNLYYRGDWGFNEHPPLFFGLQAIFFKLFGDHYYTEKLYSFFIWLTTAILIRQIWNKAGHKPAKHTYALPLLMWCMIPTITWGYTNNILDCTMAMFDLAAVLVLYRGLQRSDKLQPLILFIGALLTAAAVMTKGPVGAFPLAVPGLWWIVNVKNANVRFGNAVLKVIIITLFFTGIFMALNLIPEAHANFESYVNEQLAAALQGKREITGGGLGRFNLLVDLFTQLLIPIIISLVVFAITKALKLKAGHVYKHKNTAFFFLIIGIVASLPMLLSVKQRTFYLVPSLPFYVLSVSVLIYPIYISLTDKWKVGAKGVRYFKMISAVIIAGLCIYLGSKFGQVGRNHELIYSMKYIGTQFPKRQTFGICAEADKDYEFLAYLQRYNEMEIDPVFYTQEYVLIDNNLCNSQVQPIVTEMGFEQQPFELERYSLYKRKFPLRFDFTLLHPAFRTGDR